MMQTRNARPGQLGGTTGRAQNGEQQAGHSSPVYIPDGTPAYAAGRRVGTWCRDEHDTLWLVKGGLVQDRHQVKYPTRGWSTESEHITMLQRDPRPGGLRLECRDGEVWTARLSSLLRYGRPFNRNHGAQWFMAATDWRREGYGVHQPELFDLGDAS
jgi:hypothetical protein